jgi:rhomboid family GlyGly-CTERM serine protease
VIAVSRVPWLTALILGASVVVSGASGVAERLQFEPAIFMSGEWWRGLSCHFAHCSPDHLLWNVAALGTLGAVCESHARRGFLWLLAFTMIAVPLTLLLLQPELPSYRGLSGLASGCFTLVTVRIARRAAVHGERWRAVAACVLLGLFAAKTVFELVRGEAVFADGAAAGFVPVPLAHAVAGAVGLVVGWTESRVTQEPVVGEIVGTSGQLGDPCASAP